MYSLESDKSLNTIVIRVHPNCSKKPLLTPITQDENKEGLVSHDAFQEMLNSVRHKLISQGEKEKVF